MYLSQFQCGAKHFDANRAQLAARAWDKDKIAPAIRMHPLQEISPTTTI
jgi:hypothetical protein